MILLCGSILRDDDPIPSEAFEENHRLTFEEDVYRARCESKPSYSM
jgi:hypothetical protein